MTGEQKKEGLFENTVLKMKTGTLGSMIWLQAKQLFLYLASQNKKLLLVYSE